MMKIQSVLIDGFKNISNVKINFDNITALVGLNNYGKSNVLSAIDFGLKFIKASLEEKNEMMSNSNLIPINSQLLGRNYKFEIEILSEMNDVKYHVYFGYEFSWKCEESKEPFIVSEFLRIRPEEKGQKYTQLINRNLENALYKSSETGRCSSKINVNTNELVVNKLRAFDEIFYIDIIENINGMKFYMENNLDAKSFYQPDPIIRKGLEDMTVDADNLPRVIYQLSINDKHKFEQLKYVYKILFPDVEDIIIKQYKFDSGDNEQLPADAPFIFTNAIYVLYVKNKNLIHPIDFTMMSDGSKRVFMILTRIILANIAKVSLIAVEEPENSIHPGLFQDYLNIIEELLDNCKIIITSHSPYIIDYLKTSLIYVGMNKNPGVAEFFTFKKNGKRLLQQHADTLKISLGDYLFWKLAKSENDLSDYLECGANE